MALVAGGTGALGQAVVRAFLDRGCLVVATYRSERGAQQLHDAIGASADRLMLAHTDVTSSAAIGAVVADVIGRWGGIDYLVTTVGGRAGGAPTTSPLTRCCLA